MQEHNQNSLRNYPIHIDLNDDRQAEIRHGLQQARELAFKLQQQRIVEKESLLKPYTL